MRLVFILLALAGATSTTVGQGNDFTARLQQLLAVEDTASTAASVMSVTHRLEELALSHPDEWLAHYWAAFAYTQLGLFTGLDDRTYPYLDLAQVYYDKSWDAWKEEGGESDTERADLLVLQGFIYSWQASVSEEETEQNQWRARFESELDKVAELDRDNPMLWMLRGLDKMRKEETRQAGIEEARKAWRLYDREKRSPVHPDWGKSFIQYWFQRHGVADQLDGKVAKTR